MSFYLGKTFRVEFVFYSQCQRGLNWQTTQLSVEWRVEYIREEICAVNMKMCRDTGLCWRDFPWVTERHVTPAVSSHTGGMFHVKMRWMCQFIIIRTKRHILKGTVKCKWLKVNKGAFHIQINFLCAHFYVPANVWKWSILFFLIWFSS